MDIKEKRWHEQRCGYISASSLDKLMTPGRGKMFGDTAISYLYSVQLQRTTGIPYSQVDAPALTFGRENEPYAVAWIRENAQLGGEIYHCDQDFAEKIFTKVDWAMFGASPDAFVGFEPIKALVEIKCTYSEGQTAKYFSPTKSYDSKKAMALSEHRAQLAGQFLAYPDIDVIHLVKYNPQRDDNEFDVVSPVDSSRGIVFHVTRSELGDYLLDVRDRIEKADKYLQMGLDLDSINDFYK